MTTTEGHSAPGNSGWRLAAAMGRPVRTFLTDFAVALLVFSAVVGAFSVTSGYAFPAPPPPDLLPLAQAHAAAFVPALAVAAPMPLLEVQPSPLTSALLVLTFASLTAFNLAVWRHLRTAYASPRRRS